MPEESWHVVVLQYRPVIVQDGQIGAGVVVEVVGGASVVIVVDDGGQQTCEDLEIWQPRLVRKRVDSESNIG